MTDYDMTPKRAIIIILILFLVMAMAFTFLYLKKQLADSGAGDYLNPSTDSVGQGKATTVQQKIEAIETKTNQQVEQIVEQGQTATGGVTVDAQKKIDEVVSQEIIEKMKLRTPEQLKADEQRRAEQAERDRLINEQIKKQLQNK